VRERQAFPLFLYLRVLRSAFLFHFSSRFFPPVAWFSLFARFFHSLGWHRLFTEVGCSFLFPFFFSIASFLEFSASLPENLPFSFPSRGSGRFPRPSPFGRPGATLFSLSGPPCEVAFFFFYRAYWAFHFGFLSPLRWFVSPLFFPFCLRQIFFFFLPLSRFFCCEEFFCSVSPFHFPNGLTRGTFFSFLFSFYPLCPPFPRHRFVRKAPLDFHVLVWFLASL